jgi:hypothetical protein
MRSMRSMHGGFISRSRGPLQKVCHGPARMSGHDCLPGPQAVCSPEGDRMNKTKKAESLGELTDMPMPFMRWSYFPTLQLWSKALAKGPSESSLARDRHACTAKLLESNPWQQYDWRRTGFGPSLFSIFGAKINML